MTVPMLGPGQRELICRLAARRSGVTRADCVDRFDISYDAAWRTFRRLVRDGLLWPTEERRRDWMGFSKKPSVVFRAKRVRGGR